MEPLRQIQEFEHLKILADSRRLAILRLLMAEPATLSQLGMILGDHPAKVRHHVKLLERAGLIEMIGMRPARGFVEKYYQARSQAFALQQLILPAGADTGTITILGSHDLALELLAQHFGRSRSGITPLLVIPVGSLEGLVGLRQGLAQVAACHLLDSESGEYNRTYARHFFPDGSVSLVTLANREQGLMVAPGNPLGIHRLEDLGRGEVTMINRNPGSGTRVWLDRSLQQLGILPADLHGYDHEVRTHTALAEAIRSGRASAGVGLRAAASRFELDFIPLFEERFDLVASTEALSGPQLGPVMEWIAGAGFRRQVDGLPGYSTSQTGSQITP